MSINKTQNNMKNLVVVALLVFLTACGGEKDKKSQLNDLKKEKAKIEDQIRKLEAELNLTDTVHTKGKSMAFTTVEPATFLHYLQIQAKVEADENVTINASMPGTVTGIYVVAGQAVKKGQVLAELDNAVYKKGLEEAKNGLDLATQVYEKQKRLWDQKIGTEIQYLSAKKPERCCREEN